MAECCGRGVGHIVQICRLSRNSVKVGSAREHRTRIVRVKLSACALFFVVGPVGHAVHLLIVDAVAFGPKHVVIDALVLVVEIVLLEIVDLARIHKVVFALVHRLHESFLVGSDIMVHGRHILILVVFGKADERAYERTVRARVFGEVSRPPDDAPVLGAVALEGTVPAVDDIGCKIFGLDQIFFFSGDPVGVEKFAYEPLLVVVDVVDSVDGCRMGAGSAVYSVNGPVRTAGV